VGTPKAGVFAEGQAAVVAASIIAGQAGAASPVEYDGSGKCYLEFGRDGVARVEVTFMPGRAPSGTFEPASAEGTALKAEFGTTRIRRWFGRDWS
jgi:sulfide:quinone oxidoreductase